MIANVSDLLHQTVGGAVDLGGILAQDPGDQVDIVDSAVVENSPTDFQIVQAGQWGVPRRGLYHVDMAHLPLHHPPPHAGERGVEPPVEGAEERPPHLGCSLGIEWCTPVVGDYHRELSYCDLIQSQPITAQYLY